MTCTRSVVVGCGSALPRKAVSNAELEAVVETSDAWITQRTGIRQRHIAAEDETTSVLGIKAAQAALADAGLGVDDIDLIICATSTPDNTFPSTARRSRPGSACIHGAAFDLQAVCNRFRLWPSPRRIISSRPARTGARW